MKKFITLSLSLVLLAPACAMAQAPGLRANIQAEVQASTSARTPKLGTTIKNIASSTRAELSSSASSTVEMVRARVAAIKQLIEKKRDDMKARADDARVAARERFGEHIEQLVGRVSSRLASSSANLDAIAGRIDTRIDALQEQGHDMSSSIALLAEARTDLSAANDKILAVNIALEAAMSTSTPKSQIPGVRTAVAAAEDALRLVKDDLIKTIRSVRVESGATTTISN